jgi:tripeptidyl-peptidase-1
MIAVTIFATILASVVYGFKQSKLVMIDNPEWTQETIADGNTAHTLIFAVQQKNLDVLEKKLLDISSPFSKNYGKYLTFQDIGDLTSSLDYCNSVTNWLSNNQINIDHSTTHCHYITATATVSKWSEIFQTQFYVFTHSSGAKMIRAYTAQLPLTLSESLFAVFNIIDSESPITKKIFQSKSTSNIGDDYFEGRSLANDADVTVQFLNELYNIGSNNGSSHTSQCVFETSNQLWSPSDLTTFQENYGLTQQMPITVAGGTSEVCTFDSCGEANLDIQYLMGVSQVTTTYYWYSDSYLQWIVDVSNSADPPLVNSISYGSDEIQYTDSKMTAFNNEAMKLGAQGVTIFVSSGDDGVSNVNCACDKNNGYVPSFPATSPYVTAVGATQGPERSDPEIVCQSTEGGVITSGGGFSTFFTAPSYQKSAISQYFSVVSPQPHAGYNQSNRGYPDVALIGVKYQVIIDGVTINVYGTSASAPVFAAMVSLINSKRYELNMPSLGFLNPALYAAAQNLTQALMYNDVINGNNSCCAASEAPFTCCAAGFNAASGWDPATGWGSVDFALFAKYIGGVDVEPYVGSDDDNSQTAIDSVKDYLFGLSLVMLILVVVSATCVSCAILNCIYRNCCKRLCCGKDYEDSRPLVSTAI